MKQGFFWFGIISLLMTRVALAWSPADHHDIALMENRLFSQMFEREAPEVRLNRIERAVYGVNKPGQVESRLSALRNTLPALSQNPVAKNTVNQAPFKGKFAQAASPVPQSTSVKPESNNQKQSGESDYPLVDELERRVMTQTFPQDDLTVRVPRLETRVFGQPQQGDWSNRVDALHDKVIGRGKAVPNPNDDPDAMTSTGDTGDFNVSPEQIQPSVARMEQQLFKQTYAHEPIETRLARIETKLFAKPAPPELTPEERVERIIAVAGAGGERPTQTRSTAANIAIQLAPILIMMLPLII